MKYKNNKHLEYTIAIFIISLPIFSILVDFSIIRLPLFFIMKTVQPEELLNTLFSVQASVATISIAIIALITGFSTESMYGISVSNYIMQIKPHILKHKIIIMVNLVLIIINYFSLAYSLYNLSISILVVSVVLSLKMVIDISQIFHGKRELQQEIKHYIMQHYSPYYISQLNDDTISSIESNNSLIVNSNIKLLSEILNNEILKCTQSNTTDIFENIQNIFVDICLNVFRVGNQGINIKLLNEICSLYKEANKEAISPIPLRIWDNIQREYYKVITTVPFEELQKEDIIIDYHRQLYINLNVTSSENGDSPKNCQGVDSYASRVYFFFFKNQQNVNLLENQRQLIKTEIIDEILIALQYYTFDYYNDFKKSLLQRELCSYIKTLIDNDEQQIIKEKLFEQLYFYRENDGYFLKTLICILIYLYYLACREISINIEEKKKIAKNILFENKDYIVEFLYLFDYKSMKEDDIDALISQLRTWEEMPQREAKSVIMQYVIEDFLIFSALTKYWSEDQLYSFIKMIAKTILLHCIIDISPKMMI